MVTSNICENENFSIGTKKNKLLKGSRLYQHGSESMQISEPSTAIIQLLFNVTMYEQNYMNLKQMRKDSFFLGKGKKYDLQVNQMY